MNTRSDWSSAYRFGGGGSGAARRDVSTVAGLARTGAASGSAGAAGNESDVRPSVAQPAITLQHEGCAGASQGGAGVRPAKPAPACAPCTGAC